jgi:hydroxyethylthiazole kinase-like uncharacterized protein yjeF
MSDSMLDLRRRFGALTSAHVAALDRAAVESGVTVAQLMEIAGWQAARLAWQLLGNGPAAVLVVAGHGNNGGDGLVAARHLATWGCSVSSFVVADAARVTGLIAEHLASARNSGVNVEISEDLEHLRAALANPQLVIDALLGTGLSSAPREPQASAIRGLNESGARLLSVDVPSGLDATSGATPGACVHAATTCTLTAMKAGLWEPTAREFAGGLVVGDIGMPRAAWGRCGLAQPSDVRGGGLSPVPSQT